MRLDKFLKASRLVKRRTLAKEVCDQGRVQINGRPSKAGTAVAVGDTISIRFGNRTLCGPGGVPQGNHPEVRSGRVVHGAGTNKSG